MIDASAAVDLLLAVPERGEAIVRRVREHAPALAAPHLIDAEVAQVLRRYVLRSEIASERTTGALRDRVDLRLHREAHTPLLERAFS